MIKFKIDVADALERAGFNSYKAKKTGLLSQDTFRKLKKDDASISLKSLNTLCLILDMDIKDLVRFELSGSDGAIVEKIKEL